MIKFISLALTLFFFTNVEVHAYIDPGSGSSILHIVMAFFATVGATLVYFWHKVVTFIKSLFSKK